MSAATSAVPFAWGLAALLFLLSQWKPAAGLGRRHRHAATAGGLVLAGAAVYGADIINLPEIAGALVIGAATGLLLVRELPLRLLPRLTAALAGSVGIGMACAALAIRCNPYAFGLLGEESASVAPGRVAALAIAMVAGLMAGGAAIPRSVSHGRGRASLALAALLMLLAGGSLAMFAWSERTSWLIAGGALAVPAGAKLGNGVRRGGQAALLAVTTALTGGSVACIAFLLENTGLVVAGGMAASAGGVLALRLCGGRGGKGLADERRHA